MKHFAFLWAKIYRRQTLTHDGTININATANATYLLSVSGTATLAGTGAVVLGGNDSRLDSYFGGFINNFDFNNLSITGDKSYSFLTDWFDNGNLSSDEVLYVNNLTVQGYATLDLDATLNLNHLKIYANNKPGPDKLVTILDDQAAWLGGGHIIDQAIVPTPLPSTWLLLGSALLGLAGWRSRQR